MNDSEESTWIERYFDIIKETFRGKKYEKYISDALRIYDWNRYNPFVFCLSEKSDALSQWRAYSADGRGVCIGFSTKAMNISNEPPAPNVNADNTIGLLPIEYGIRNQNNKILELAQEFKDIYDKKEDEMWEISHIFFGLTLTQYSLTFKNPSFSEEKEWRIIHTPNDSAYQEESDTEKRISELQFRVINDKIVTYHEYNLEDKFDSNLVKKIVLGPKSNIDIPELEQFLQYHNFTKTKVMVSKSTYR